MYGLELKNVTEKFKNDWKNYTKLSVETYDKRWSLTPQRVGRYRQKFRPGKRVLYYVGDKREARGKWRQKWTGPWRIDKQINDSTLIISDPSTGDQKRVSYDRIKIYNEIEQAQYLQYSAKDDDYIIYQEQLQDALSRYNVKTHDKTANLDYSRRDVSRNMQ